MQRKKIGQYYKHTIEKCQEYAKLKGGKCLSSIYIGKESKMIWKCNCGYEWETKFNHIKNSNTWCPQCQYKKNAINQNKKHIKIHWKTNEELVCQASWEAKVVDYLNNNQINYLWQPETFKLSTGKTYRPDLYLIDEDRWIEIK